MLQRKSIMGKNGFGPYLSSPVNFDFYGLTIKKIISGQGRPIFARNFLVILENFDWTI